MFCTVYVQTQTTVSFWATLQRNDKTRILFCFVTDKECRKGSFLSFMRERIVLFNKLVTEIQYNAVLS